MIILDNTKFYKILELIMVGKQIFLALPKLTLKISNFMNNSAIQSSL